MDQNRGEEQSPQNNAHHNGGPERSAGSPVDPFVGFSNLGFPLVDLRFDRFPDRFSRPAVILGRCRLALSAHHGSDFEKFVFFSLQRLINGVNMRFRDGVEFFFGAKHFVFTHI